MKQITQKEFDKLPIINGLRDCPKSDFSQIKFLGKVVIPDWSIIGDESDVGERSIIGNHVIIGRESKISDGSIIGNHVKIGDFSKVRDHVEIGHNVKVGHGVIIHDYVKISNFVDISSYVKIGDFAEIGDRVKIDDFAQVGEFVKFGAYPKFGRSTKFKAETAFEDKGIAKPGYPIRIFQGFGSKNSDICFYNLVSGIYVRDGCFLGTKEEFIKKTKSDGDAKKLAEYIMMVQMAEFGFSN